MNRSRYVAALLGAALVALAGCSDDTPPVAQEAAGNGVCLQADQIDHSEIKDDSTIVFFMKNGKTFKNTLTFSCPGLTIEGGFTFVSDIPEVCSDAQTIRVARAGNFCELGQFTPYETPVAPPAPPPAAP